MKKKMMITMIACLGVVHLASAQKAAIKTNLLYDATTTFNLGAEFALSPKWTLDVSGNYNPWTFSNNKKWKHWLVQPHAGSFTKLKRGGPLQQTTALYSAYEKESVCNCKGFAKTLTNLCSGKLGAIRMGKVLILSHVYAIIRAEFQSSGDLTSGKSSGAACESPQAE